MKLLFPFAVVCSFSMLRGAINHQQLNSCPRNWMSDLTICDQSTCTPSDSTSCNNTRQIGTCCPTACGGHNCYYPPAFSQSVHHSVLSFGARCPLGGWMGNYPKLCSKMLCRRDAECTSPGTVGHCCNTSCGGSSCAFLTKPSNNCPTSWRGRSNLTCGIDLCTDNAQCLKNGVMGQCCMTLCKGHNCYFAKPPQPVLQPKAPPTGLPTLQPTPQSTLQPTPQSTSHPTNHPTPQASTEPTDQQTTQPILQPTSQLTTKATVKPKLQPTTQSTTQPTTQPTPQTSTEPTAQSTTQPTVQPTQPTTQPTLQLTTQPTPSPTTQSNLQPITQLTLQPIVWQTLQPSSCPQIWGGTHANACKKTLCDENNLCSNKGHPGYCCYTNCGGRNCYYNAVTSPAPQTTRKRTFKLPNYNVPVVFPPTPPSLAPMPRNELCPDPLIWLGNGPCSSIECSTATSCTWRYFPGSCCPTRCGGLSCFVQNFSAHKPFRPKECPLVWLGVRGHCGHKLCNQRNDCEKNGKLGYCCRTICGGRNCQFS